MIYENMIIAFIVCFVIQYILFKHIKYSMINATIFSSLIGLIELLNTQIKFIENLENISFDDKLKTETESRKVLIEPEKTEIITGGFDNTNLSDETPINKNDIKINPKPIADMQKIPTTKKEMEDKMKKELTDTSGTYPIENKDEEDILKKFSIIDPKYWYETNLQKEATCNMGCPIYPTYINDTSSFLRIDKLK